jgi:hypothetical protein
VLLELEVLAIQAVEGAGVIKNSEVFVAVFRAPRNSILGIARTGAARAHKASNTVGGQGIIVGIKVALVGAAAVELAPCHIPKAAKAHAPLRNLAPVHAQRTDDPVF